MATAKLCAAPMNVNVGAESDFADANTLRSMQRLVQRTWGRQSRFHIGDLAWQWATRGDSPFPARLWHRAGEVAAWGLVEARGQLSLAVDRRWNDLAGDVLSWFEQSCSGAALTVTVLDAELHLVEALRSRGYVEVPDGPFDLFVAFDLADLHESPALPMGLRFLSMADTADLTRRVESHRSAWHPSAMTVERYRRVMAAWPYRPELDWMIEIADGRFVANTCVWHDELNGVGLVEPLGVDPGFRRQGLARAVVLRALHALRALGARFAITYPRGDTLYPFTKPLYLGLGFKPYARTVKYARQV